MEEFQILMNAAAEISAAAVRSGKKLDSQTAQAIAGFVCDMRDAITGRMMENAVKNGDSLSGYSDEDLDKQYQELRGDADA